MENPNHQNFDCEERIQTQIHHTTYISNQNNISPSQNQIHNNINKKKVENRWRKKKKKKHKKNKKEDDDESDHPIIIAGDEAENGAAGQVYTIDAAKNMNYGELFPVEAKKFGYEPKSSAAAAAAGETKTIEDSLDDCVKKKADQTHQLCL